MPSPHSPWVIVPLKVPTGEPPRWNADCAMSQIAPPLSATTPLASLDGWHLVLTCPTCGDRTKPVDKLYAAVDRYREIGAILPRLFCDVCKAKPVGLRAVNSWVVKFDREAAAEDLTFLLGRMEARAA
jgi:hypothetical protein